MFEVVSQLRPHEAPPGTTLQVSFAPFRIFAVQIGFVINQRPRSAIASRERLAPLMLGESLLKIRSKPNVKARVALRLQNIHIKHRPVLSQKPPIAKRFYARKKPRLTHSRSLS